ncbi:unnamed protein product [Penicillium discolor]
MGKGQYLLMRTSLASYDFDNPDLIILTMVGDGESETGLLATSWLSTKFLVRLIEGKSLVLLELVKGLGVQAQDV